MGCYVLTPGAAGGRARTLIIAMKDVGPAWPWTDDFHTRTHGCPKKGARILSGRMAGGRRLSHGIVSKK